MERRVVLLIVLEHILIDSDLGQCQQFRGDSPTSEARRRPRERDCAIMCFFGLRAGWSFFDAAFANDLADRLLVPLTGPTSGLFRRTGQRVDCLQFATRPGSSTSKRGPRGPFDLNDRWSAATVACNSLARRPRIGPETSPCK